MLAIAYYILREHLNPDYLKAVWQNEISGRYFEVNEGNKGDFWFYYDMLKKHHYAYWFWLLPYGFFAGVLSINSSIRKLTWFCFVMSSFYGLIISFSKTKLEWYEAPLFPFMAIIIAVLIYQIFLILKNSQFVSELFILNILPYIFLFLVFYNPYQQTLDKVYFPKEYDWDVETYKLSYFLRDALKGRHDIDGHIIFLKGHKSHLQLYQHMLNAKGSNIVITENPEFKAGDKVMVSQSETESIITSQYETDLLMADGNLKSFVINRIK